MENLSTPKSCAESSSVCRNIFVVSAVFFASLSLWFTLLLIEFSYDQLFARSGSKGQALSCFEGSHLENLKGSCVIDSRAIRCLLAGVDVWRRNYRSNQNPGQGEDGQPVRWHWKPRVSVGAITVGIRVASTLGSKRGLPPLEALASFYCSYPKYLGRNLAACK